MQPHPQPTLNHKFIETIKLMNIYLNHFPNHEKYGLSQQIRVCMYECYSFFVEGYKRYHKKTTLTNLDIRHEQWRMLVNTANEMGYFNFKDGRKINGVMTETKRFRAISLLIDELGRMIGGWIAKELEISKGKATREVS